MTSASLALEFAQFDPNGHMDWGDGWWVVMVLGMLLIAGLFVAGIIWIARELGGGQQRSHEISKPDALEILDRRLAEGEISPEEYRERRAALAEETTTSER